MASSFRHRIFLEFLSYITLSSTLQGFGACEHLRDFVILRATGLLVTQKVLQVLELMMLRVRELTERFD